MKLHRIKNDQLYHYYLGDPIEVLLLRDGVSELVVVGPNIVGGHRVQLFIPGGTFHGGELIGVAQLYIFFQHDARPFGARAQEPAALSGDARVPEAAADIRTFPVPVEK